MTELKTSLNHKIVVCLSVYVLAVALKNFTIIKNTQLDEQRGLKEFIPTSTTPSPKTESIYSAIENLIQLKTLEYTDPNTNKTGNQLIFNDTSSLYRV